MTERNLHARSLCKKSVLSGVNLCLEKKELWLNIQLDYVEFSQVLEISDFLKYVMQEPQKIRTATASRSSQSLITKVNP